LEETGTEAERIVGSLGEVGDATGVASESAVAESELAVGRGGGGGAGSGAPSRAYVSGFREIMKRARAALAGSGSDDAEIRAMRALRTQGRNVHVRTTAA